MGSIVDRIMGVPIRHVHSRRFPVSRARFLSALDPFYSGTSLDPFPTDFLPTWRTAGHLRPGSRCGTGPSVFTGRMTTLGPNVRSSYYITSEGDGVHVMHVLEGPISLLMWLVWKIMLGPGHDWTMESVLDRLEIFLETGQMPTVTPSPPPFLFRIPKPVRKLLFVFMPPARPEPETPGT